MKRIVLISPSGAFYGSEQVLFDFLSTTTNIYDVYVPMGKFHEILNRQAKHIIHSYDNILWLYINLLMRLAVGHVQGIYINEGGHIRYLKILAKIFRHKSFYAHIRLLEDTEKSRLEGTPDNIKLIAVSDYIADAIKKKTNLPVVTIYDLYQSNSHVSAMRKPKASGTINIGIVGRITDTKGIDAIEKFCDYTEQQAHFQKPVTVNFFGHVDSLSAKTNVFINKANKYKNIKCLFHGYISEKFTIYTEIDILLHFNQLESLGRIAFEALDYGIPFIGFNRGGIGEIASQLCLDEYMINPDDSDWCSHMLNNVFAVLESPTALMHYESARQKMHNIYSPKEYVSQIEELFI